MADLDPRTALAYAKRMKDYCDAFNGRDWAAVMLHGSPDEQNLAHALDNLTECAAMLMNMAGRVAGQAQLTDAQIAAGLVAANAVDSTFDYGDGSTAAEREAAHILAFREATHGVLGRATEGGNDGN